MKAARWPEGEAEKAEGISQGPPGSDENCSVTRCHLPASCSQNSCSCWGWGSGRGRAGNPVWTHPGALGSCGPEPGREPL